MCFITEFLQYLRIMQGALHPTALQASVDGNTECSDFLQGITNLAPYSFFNVMSFDPVSSSVMECRCIVILDTNDILFKSACCAL